MRYAVIGTGWITQAFIDGAKLQPDMTLAAVYSRSYEKGLAMARLNGCDTVFTDINALAAGDFDAVYIAGPNFLHSSHSELMLKAGKHVICEKPITVEPRELEYLQALAGEKELVYIEAIMHMFNPVRHSLREAMGEIGKITSAHFDFSQLSSKYPALKSGELPNIFNPAIATGCLMDLGIYCVYPALDYFGEPLETEATSLFISTGADACGSAQFIYDDKYVTLTYSKLGQDRVGSQIFGDEGTIVIGSVSKLTDIKIVYNDGSEKPVVGDIEKAVLMGNEARAFCDFINNPRDERYAEAKKAALAVSRKMREIRTKAGIEFPCAPIR